jgi:hypothetical protein
MKKQVTFHAVIKEKEIFVLNNGESVIYKAGVELRFSRHSPDWRKFLLTKSKKNSPKSCLC